MNKDQRITAAIHLVMEADEKLGAALRILNGHCPLAAENIVDSQWNTMEAITRMQTRTLLKRQFDVVNKNLAKGLTRVKKPV